MFTLKRGLVVFVGVLALIIPASCSYEVIVGFEQRGRSTDERSDSDEVSLTVEVYENGEAYFEFSNGMVAESEEEYLAILEDLASQGVSLSEINLLTEEDSEEDGYSEEGEDYGWQRDPLEFGIWGTSYHIVFVGPHTRWVGGGRECINRVVSHVNFIINREGGGLVTDIHLAAWSEGGRPCVAIYVSPQNWCWRYCGPSYADIRNGIASALIAVGISASVAAIMASILAPIGVGALAL